MSNYMLWYSMLWYKEIYDVMFCHIRYVLICCLIIFDAISYDICYDTLWNVMLCYMIWYVIISRVMIYEVMWCHMIWYDMLCYDIWIVILYHMIYICYLPAGRSVSWKTVTEVLTAARGRRPRAAFSSPRSQFFTIRTDPKPVNNLFIFFLP